MGRMQTRLTEMLGIEHPVMLAGMGGVSYHAIVAAVSDAGGFGTLGAATMSSEQLDDEMAAVRAATDKPFGVDLLAALPERMLADAHKVVSGGASLVAAGGIFDGRGLAAAIALGADGVWLGTRFIATPEARTVRGYKEALLRTSEDGTVISRGFTGKTLRAVRNEWTQHIEEHPEELT